VPSPGCPQRQQRRARDWLIGLIGQENKQLLAAALHPSSCNVPVLSCLLPAAPQELLSERARLAAEVESLKASTAAEASSSKAELGAQRDKLEQQLADLAARAEAVTAGDSWDWHPAQSALHMRHTLLSSQMVAAMVHCCFWYYGH